MIQFLLDTDTLSLYQRGHPLVTQKIAARSPGEAAVSVISVEEQLTGWYTRIRQAKKRAELAAISGLPMLSAFFPGCRSWGSVNLRLRAMNDCENLTVPWERTTCASPPLRLRSERRW